jgi:hypothetical protein
VPVANSTVYSETNETGGRTTAYAYTWFSSTAAMESMAVTLPSVSSGQNGPGTSDTQVTFFDASGRPIWRKDGDNALHYLAYDKVSGAVSKSITDVDTDETGDFTALPSGWSSSAGLHLESDY